MVQTTSPSHPLSCYQTDGSLNAISNPASPVLGGRNVTGAAGATTTGADGATAARTTGVGVLLRGAVKMPCGTCWKTCGMTGMTTGGIGVAVGVDVGGIGVLTTGKAVTTNVAFAGPPGGDSLDVTVLVAFGYEPAVAELTETTIWQLADGARLPPASEMLAAVTVTVPIVPQ